MYKEIIVLARSSKKGGYCVAGVDTITGEWIRPISNDILNEGAVPLSDIIYSNSEKVEIFDIVRIRLTSHSSTRSQPENYIYDNRERWKRVGKSSLKEVIKFRGYDEPDRIFYNTKKSVTESEINGQPSLLLLNVKNSYIFIKTFPEKKKIQLNFEYNNEEYKFIAISDERINKIYRDMADGSYNEQANLSVVFSLTDKFAGTNEYYKMAAQLFYNF